ncbi:MAG: type I secretion system permease/ATPase [Desulfobulbaceae bacterium]|nr:type I secretion system permease/ATPase [Desulfobulbaceae bacterium]
MKQRSPAHIEMTTKKIQNKKKEWVLPSDTDSHDDPLLDCLVQIAKIHGRNISRTSLRAGLPLVNNQLTIELFPRAASRAGLSSRLVHRELQSITDLEMPAILLLSNQRACIALKFNKDNNTLKLILPESGTGSGSVSIEIVEKNYNGYTLFIRPKFSSKVQSDFTPDNANGSKWFWSTIFRSWRIYRDVLVASFLINVFGLATPLFILNVYDRVIPNNAVETLWVLAIGIGVIYGFDLMMKALRGYFIDEAGKKASLEMSATLFEKVFSLRMEAKPKSVGAFTKNLQQFENIRDFITSFTISALIDLPFIFLGLWAIWFIAGNMMWIHVGAICILITFAFCIQLPLKKAVVRTVGASSQKNAVLVEGLAGMETIKMLGAEGQIQRSWEESVAYIAKWSAKSRFYSSLVRHISSFVQNFTIVAVIVLGVYMIADGLLTQGGLIACVILSRRAIAPISQVVNLATRYHRAKESLIKLNEIMELPSERPAGKNFLHRTGFRGEIELKNVDFSYPGQSIEALRSINFKIEAGEKIAILGSVGSGKTTLGKLLLGLYQPSSGMVAMDGTDIRQIDPAELRSCIGYVQQDVNLFQGSIKDNILLGVSELEDSMVLRAAGLAGVADFVRAFPKGYDMEVGEYGRNLSGGQRKAVALARALVLDPPVLVLDEPTSSMDSRFEAKIKKSLSSILTGKTLIIITHRASLLDLVDRIIVLDNKTIVADGPKNRVIEMLQSGGIAM